MKTTRIASTRGVSGIAIAAGGGFAAFYTFYTAAPLVFEGSGPSPGTRVAIVMMIVIVVQPLILLAGGWTKDRRQVVIAALISMSVGIATLPLGDHWPGAVLLGLGFGVFVVISAAWVKEQAQSGQIGRALGIYGFGSAVGGAIGAPAGVYFAQQLGLLGVVLIGSAFAAFAIVPVANTRNKTMADLSNVDSVTQTVSVIPTDKVPPSFGAKRAWFAIAIGHVLAVTVYAAVLSASGTVEFGSVAWITPIVAFLIQTSLALGRLVGGAMSDRRSMVTASVSLVLLTIGATGFMLCSSTEAMVIASVVVGFASGVGQTAALTGLMRRAKGSLGTERASATWNIGFDMGLGAGAVLAVSLGSSG